MTLNQLECFVVLAQRLNFTQAAEALFMAQPALSRTISALEQELEVQLFYRNSRSVSLTPAGTAFLRECPHIFESYRHSLEAARLAQQGYQGQVTLGVLQDAFDPAVVGIFHEMKAAYPKIRLTLQEYSHSELVRYFEAGALDAIVNFGMDAFPEEQARSITLCHNQQCAVLPLSSPLSKKPLLRMEELRDEPFVVMSRTASQPGHDFLWHMAADAGFVPNVVAEARHIPSLLTLVACGLGVTTLTDDLAYLAKGQAAFVPLVGVPFSKHSFIWRKDDLNPSLPFLVEVVERWAKNANEPRGPVSPGF